MLIYFPPIMTLKIAWHAQGPVNRPSLAAAAGTFMELHVRTATALLNIAPESSF
jgi:hypothetical protein